MYMYTYMFCAVGGCSIALRAYQLDQMGKHEYCTVYDIRNMCREKATNFDKYASVFVCVVFTE